MAAELPAGFVLDEPTTSAELPEGFVLDEDTRIDMDAAAPREMGAWESGVQGFRDMATLGYGPELSAAAGTVGRKIGLESRGKGWGDIYDEELGVQEAANVQAQIQSPNAYTAGEVAGVGATMMLPGAGPVGRGVKGVADTAVKTAISKPIAAGVEALAKTGIGQKVAPLINKGFKHAGELGSKWGATEAGVAKLGAKSAVEAALPQTAIEAVGALIGHSVLPVAGVPVGVHAVRQTAKKIIGTKTLFGREGTKFARKYGEWLAEIGQRGIGATTANVFIKQQQDPEFREMLKAAKDEAAKAE